MTVRNPKPTLFIFIVTRDQQQLPFYTFGSVGSRDVNAGAKDETTASGGKKYVELKRQRGDNGRGDSVGQ